MKKSSDGWRLHYPRFDGDAPQLEAWAEVQVSYGSWWVTVALPKWLHNRVYRWRGASYAPVGHNLGPPLEDPAVNPKELAGAKKPATWSVMPRWVMLMVGRVMSIGAGKYGAFNYRQSRIYASTYQDAMERHAQLWFDGEDDDPETGVSHLASIIASCVLLLDSQATGQLEDDRQKTGVVRKTLDDLERLLKTNPIPNKGHST